MTYVSRRTRIIVSRWLDECDAEYRLRACRKRSEGRLKKYSSADDFRAWVNDNCIKHEHFLDLMSNGEFSERQPFRLYGRFIPVPVLFQLAQNSKTVDGDVTVRNLAMRRSKSATCRQFSNCIVNEGEGVCNEGGTERRRSSSSCRKAGSTTKSNCDLIRAQWENNQLEKNLLECTCLLNKAIEKLEKIDTVVGLAEAEAENARKQEIREAFGKAKFSCSCSVTSSANNTSDCVSSSKSYVKKLKDSAKYNELMRKISNLREKLLKIQECRQEVNQQIESTKRRVECASSLQVTELFSHREEVNMKRLEKKLEKLIAEKGRLLSELYQALTSLNNIKNSSRSIISPRRDNSKSPENRRFEKVDEIQECQCNCKSCGSCGSSDSLKSRCSESSIGSYVSHRQSVASGQTYIARDLKDCYCGNTFNEKSKATLSSSRSQTNQKGRKLKKCKSRETKKSKVQFVCPEPVCKKKLDSDDVSAYENSLTPEQQSIISGVLKNIKESRPSTSPTTKKERQAAGIDMDSPYQRLFGRNNPERRVKSETTMKEIEKTLRNYERRLGQLDGLERRVEEMKEKTSEVQCLRKNLEKMKAETQMQREAEREKSEREISRLCSENWELKQQVEQLTAKFNAQVKKIQNLKCGAMKARELECQAEELKKELSEYRQGFEHQRECICKWESVVAVQRTEIENLMNHIRMLTKMKEDSASNLCQQKKFVQRSKSCNRDVRPGDTRGATMRPRTQGEASNPTSDDDSATCQCGEYQKPTTRRMSQLKSFTRGCCSPETRRMEWCT